MSRERLDEIAAMYIEHHQALRRLVHTRALRHGRLSETIVDDACSFAWMQLVRHDHVDLRGPHWRAVGWLTQVAINEAWRLYHIEHAAMPLEPDVLDAAAAAHDHSAPGAGDVAEQRIRLELVELLPERPRRFLMRLALGYTYDEIAAAEDATYRTVNKQLVRARRLLRELETPTEQGGEQSPPKP